MVFENKLYIFISFTYSKQIIVDLTEALRGAAANREIKATRKLTAGFEPGQLSWKSNVLAARL